MRISVDPDFKDSIQEILYFESFFSSPFFIALYRLCLVNSVDVRSCTHQEAVLALLQPCDVMLLKVMSASHEPTPLPPPPRPPRTHTR